MSNSTSRRDFLRKSLSFAVISTAVPSTLLGRIYPVSYRTTAKGQILATFTLNISDFGDALFPVGGSIKLKRSEEEMRMNPDHCQRSGISNEDFPIAITRIKETGSDAFAAVSTYCTHGEDYQLNDYNPLGGYFVCPHENSTFMADGTWIRPEDSPFPDAPDVGEAGGMPDNPDLRKFPTEYDGNDTITLFDVLVNCQTSDVDDYGNVAPDLFLDQNYPNPFNPSTMVRYGIPMASSVKLAIHSLNGELVRTVVNTQQEPGIHIVDVHMRDLPSGGYLYTLETEMGTLTKRMTIAK